MPQPASTCPNCLKEGSPSTDQTDMFTKKLMKGATRFVCPAYHVWLADTEDAIAHGAFLHKARLA